MIQKLCFFSPVIVHKRTQSELQNNPKGWKGILVAKNKNIFFKSKKNWRWFYFTIENRGFWVEHRPVAVVLLTKGKRSPLGFPSLNFVCPFQTKNFSQIQKSSSFVPKLGFYLEKILSLSGKFFHLLNSIFPHICRLMDIRFWRKNHSDSLMCRDPRSTEEMGQGGSTLFGKRKLSFILYEVMQSLGAAKRRREEYSKKRINYFTL